MDYNISTPKKMIRKENQDGYYVDGIPTSDMKENNEVLFCEISDALAQNDCTEMTKVSLRRILNDSADYLYSNIEYKVHKGSDYTLYI